MYYKMYHYENIHHKMYHCEKNIYYKMYHYSSDFSCMACFVERSLLNKYVFDPDLRTVTPPYERCVSKEKCDHMFRDLVVICILSLMMLPLKTVPELFSQCDVVSGQ